MYSIFFFCIFLYLIIETSVMKKKIICHKNSFIVAGKEGIFKVDISKGQSIKLTDNEKENPVTKIRLTPNGKILYYQRNLDYNKISALEL